MTKYVWLALLVIMPLGCCGGGLLKKPIMIDGVLEQKVRIDTAENPAMKQMIRKELGNRKILLSNVTVKDVVEATNLDYDYCVIVDVPGKKGMVECHVYSNSVKTIAKLVNGRSKIDVDGVFNRFFSLLDDYGTRVEIVNACITIK
ncbi:MAG: hypothetical protein JW807_16295 [Spirochaetes bacterium]|nr:hypothetical protein [Spirochaetota bacterium]